VAFFVTVAVVIEESNEATETLGMLLSPKRLITYFYPLLLLHFSTPYYMNIDTGSRQKPKYKTNQATKQVKTAGDSTMMMNEAKPRITVESRTYLRLRNSRWCMES
jgi:hypothetical protein